MIEKLSKIFLIDSIYTLDDVVNYCLDNKITSIINDIPDEPWVEYSLSDLEMVWNQLKELKK